MGYGDLSCYGNENIQTPNLDAMALSGMKFLDYHSNGAVCSPTRAALMTGRYQQRSGIEGVVTAANHRIGGLSPIEITLAEIAKDNGYQTALFGKWHLGYDTSHSPIQNGFDEFVGFVSGNIDYHSHIDQTGMYDWWSGTDSAFESGYLTDIITRHAISFIERNSDQPFFLYLAHGAPHYPYQGRDDPADRSINGNFSNLGSRIDKKKAYKEMIEVLDEGVGDIIEVLKTNDILENTLVFFCSDNGATTAVGSNGALRGAKGSLWEGGHRVPAIAYWPGEIESSLNHDLILSMDLMPTLANLMGDEHQIKLQMDGQDFSPLLFGNPTSKERIVYWRFKQFASARSEEWKYLRYKDQDYLFNLETDLSEQYNLADKNKKMLQILKDSLLSWEEEMSQYNYFTGR